MPVRMLPKVLSEGFETYSEGDHEGNKLFTCALAVAILTSVLFLVLYGSASYITSLRSDVGTWYYSWEQYIPFVPVMIVPYMSIDLFFFCAPFVCSDRRELRILAWRLSAVVVIATLCFLIYPLRLAVERPVAEGVFGWIYNWFTSLDRPYNLCPSMHIALRTVLAAHYGRHSRGWIRALMNVWFFLIGCSTLLLYQHHIIDVVGGFVLAAFVMYAFDGLPWHQQKRGGIRFAFVYGVTSISMLIPISLYPSLGWFLLWPSVSCGLVAFGYLWAGPAVFRRNDGELTWPTRLLLGPVLAAQWLSWRYYSRESNVVDEVTPNVLIGRHTTEREAERLVSTGVNAVVDVCNAFSEPTALKNLRRLTLPVLDLTAPTSIQIDQTVHFIDTQQKHGKVLVHCKAGYSRSACLVAAWMLYSKKVDSVDAAINQLRSVRPEIVIRQEIRQALDEWWLHAKLGCSINSENRDQRLIARAHGILLSR